MIRRKYSINPSFFLIAPKCEDYVFYKKINQIENIIFTNRIADRVFLPENITEIISYHLYVHLQNSRDDIHDIIMILLKFIDRMDFHFISLDKSNLLYINPNVYECYISQHHLDEFTHCAYSAQSTYFISDSDFTNSISNDSFSIIQGSSNLDISVIRIQDENKYFPYFEPSDKHSYKKIHVSRQGRSILYEEDEKKCYELIKCAISPDTESKSLFAYNKDTNVYIRFNATGEGGLKYHAFPVSPNIDPLLNESLVTQIHKVYPKNQ